MNKGAMHRCPACGQQLWPRMFVDPATHTGGYAAPLPHCGEEPILWDNARVWAFNAAVNGADPDNFAPNYWPGVTPGMLAYARILRDRWGGDYPEQLAVRAAVAAPTKGRGLYG